MGIFRTLYREARDLVGLGPPAENATQMAERLCGLVKGEIGGKKKKQGDDWLLESTYEGRKVFLLFEAESARAIVVVVSELEGGPVWSVTADPKTGKEEVPDGVERGYVASGLYVQGSRAEVQQQTEMWKALPTGTRGNLGAFIQRHFGEFVYEEEKFRYTPMVSTLEGPSAKYTVKTQVQSMVRLVGEIEAAWQNL